MDDKWFDKGLNDSIGDYNSPIDLESAWNSFESKREEETNKIPLYIWWLLGLLVLVGGYFVFWSFNSIEKDETTSQIFQNVELTEKIESTSINKDEIGQVEQGFQLEIIDGESKVAENVTKGAVFLKTVNKPISNSLGKANHEQLISRKNKIHLTDYPFAHTSESLLINIESNDKSNEVRGSHSRTSKIVSTWPLTTNSLSIIQIDNAVILSNNSMEIQKIDQFRVPKDRLQTKHYISFAAGYGTKSQGRILVDEKPLDIFFGELLYQRFLSKNFYLKTGLTLDQKTNNIDVKTEEVYMENEEDQLIITNNYQSGFQENVYGSIEVKVRETTDFNIYNSYQSLHIPLFIGYNFFDNSKSSLSIETGLSASVYSRFDVKQISEVQSKTIVTSDISDFREYGLLNHLLGAQWTFKLLDKGPDLFAAYRGQFQLNKLTNLSSEIKSQAHFMSLGVRWTLE